MIIYIINQQLTLINISQKQCLMNFIFAGSSCLPTQPDILKSTPDHQRP